MGLWTQHLVGRSEKEDLSVDSAETFSRLNGHGLQSGQEIWGETGSRAGQLRVTRQELPRSRLFTTPACADKREGGGPCPTPPACRKWRSGSRCPCHWPAGPPVHQPTSVDILTQTVPPPPLDSPAYNHRDTASCFCLLARASQGHRGQESPRSSVVFWSSVTSCKALVSLFLEVQPSLLLSGNRPLCLRAQCVMYPPGIRTPPGSSKRMPSSESPGVSFDSRASQLAPPAQFLEYWPWEQRGLSAPDVINDNKSNKKNGLQEQWIHSAGTEPQQQPWRQKRESEMAWDTFAPSLHHPQEDKHSPGPWRRPEGGVHKCLLPQLDCPCLCRCNPKGP
ncbi:uncharacterized protein LOC132539842 [Erinaceus europaeus]|uniref:Uncharacterized protein LOC132539842 n=1 Tax=Erinaceus europaeus TaxID=9365 RepID=A0ABM3XSH2_ERIEU|nr:uncharacterized protein LOC132539842 [Erinaceus europaeus]